MTWIIAGLALAGTFYGYWQGFHDGRLQGRLDVLKEETERLMEDFDREMEALFEGPLRSAERPDVRRFEAQTVDELVFRLVDDGDRLIEGEG